MSSQIPAFVPATSQHTSQLLGIPTTVKVGASQNGGTYFMAEQTIPVGLGTPPHIHTREDEIFQVLEGEIEFLLGDRTIVGRAGDIVHAPRDIPHAYQSIGTQPARFQFIAIPGGIESMFAELNTWPADQPPDMARLVELCASYGISFV